MIDKNPTFETLPVITIHQPYASWTIKGLRPIEPRSHNLFGLLVNQTVLIHAGKKYIKDAVYDGININSEHLKYRPGSVPQGAILGSATIKYCKLLDKTHESLALCDCVTDPVYGVYFDNIIEFDEPIYVNGSIGIWYYDIMNKKKIDKL